VVLDATLLKREQRDAAAKVAEATGAPFLILDCNAPQAVIASWLAQRQADKNDPSDATLKVIEAQQANREPLTLKSCSSASASRPTKAGHWTPWWRRFVRICQACKKNFLAVSPIRRAAIK
jgi:predicted kinase